MKTPTISIDDDTLRQIDQAARQLKLKRSEIVRRALRLWLRTREVERFEREWISALAEHPDRPGRADEWFNPLSRDQ